MYVSHDVSTGCHVPFACFPLSDVDDAIEKVGFAMLATEVLHRDCNQYTATLRENRGPSYPTDDIIVIGKMRLAVFATVDLVGVQVDVVCKAHPEGRP
jgi:hypothetical protein